jgi:class 3 adenylate cyclase
VTKEASDYSGRNVILGTRIAAKAKGGQILVSSLLKEITESEVDIRFGDECQLELKGLDGTSRLYLVDW